MSDARSRSYETHFYCALCGGPFAQVFRTAVSPAVPSYTAQNDYNDYSCSIKGENGNEYDENLDLGNEFNIPPEDNRNIPEEVVLNNMSHAAKRSRALRLRAETEGRRRGMMGGHGTTKQAYDGRRISFKQMKWTKNLRALIYNRAMEHPQNYEHYLANGERAYLTGRGLIRQEQNWADAFASIDEDEGDSIPEVHTEHPIFSDEDRLHNTYGFHVYQELGRKDCRYVISSIPFHDECWSLLDLAIEESGKERGVEGMNERIDMDDLWGYFRGLVAVTRVDVDSATVPNSTAAALLEEHRGGEIVTRLNEVDYREGQGSGDGWQWKHESGLHWLAADPSLISVLDSPLLPVGGPRSQSCAPRSALHDPFQSLPPEILLEVCKLLTSTDIFSLKIATPVAHNVCLPESFYRRFLREEFRYLPTLVKEVKNCESTPNAQKLKQINWKGSFERLRKLMTTPNGDGDDWEHVDISLKNRNRIWKIVKPMADELVESSDAILRYKYKAPEIKAEKTGVVRGYAGVRTGKEGTIQSVYFGPRTCPLSFEDQHGETLEFTRRVDQVRIWLDGENGPLCGLGFFISDEEENELQILGRRGSSFVDLEVRQNVLTGFVFCLANHIICGIQLVYDDEHTFSKRIGQWNGSVRKVTVPISWRKLVGVIGFVNSSGFIETLGILEETLDCDREDRVGPLPIPPSTVDISHGEASVWKKLPPANKNLKILQREGPHIMDWRMCMGDWEIWENDLHEEGVEIQPQQKKSLVEIVGYYDDVALRGLEFIYREHLSTRQITSVLGSKEAEKRDSIHLKDGESIVAIVISFGDACIHGILFVTASGCTSKVFGPRYLGTHKVFAPTANIDGPSQTIFRTETNGTIVGLHCLYDQEERVFLQLGLVLLRDQYKIYEPELPRSIPFNEVGDNFQVWEDEAPPKEWSIGYRRPGEMGILDKTLSRPKFSGWVELKSLRKIMIYGKMQGIRFSFTDSPEKDRFFGFVGADSEDICIQNIDYEHGERITGIAILLDHEVDFNGSGKIESMDDEYLTNVLDKGDSQSSLGRIYFLTNQNQANLALPIRCRVSCCYLVAIKFDFDHLQLVSWAPIYAPDPAIPGSAKTVLEMVQYPWKCRTDNILPQGEIKPTSRVGCIFFDDEEDQRVDAVKGYVSKSGHFCGLVFRRGGNWEDKVFGHRSAYEVTMELEDEERFTSLYLPEGNTEALALCTNFGRTTPWFGGPVSGRTILHQAPRRKEAVGIYGTLDGDIPRFNPTESIVLDTVGILYRPKRKCSGSENRNRSPVLPRPSGFQLVDEATKLPWFNDVNAFPKGLRLEPLVAQRTGLYPDHPAVGRAYCIFDPSQLDQILVFVNLFNRAGITSIRFRGTEKMGLITMGEWPDREDIRIKRRQKMNISGLKGERIIRVKAAFQRLEREDRIVGLAIETSSGRSKTIVNSEMFPEKPISAHNVKILECGEDYEIVGFHGVVSTYNIHDIGLVLRPKTLGTRT